MAAAVFQTVLDWGSWTNDGANVAVADIDRDNIPDLIVLRVDAPADGQNTAYYRTGFQLNPLGAIEKGWGPWIPIPEWDSDQDDGAGIAVANMGGDELALVVLQVRSAGGGAVNTGRIRIGRQLNVQGQVKGGWSDWQDVPDWGSFRNQGAAIAVGSVSQPGAVDIAVLRIDDFAADHRDPALPNQAFYRVGRGLDADGQAASWGDWKRVDWDAFSNRGGGIALAELDQPGRTDLVVFQIDNRDGENSGRYRVGWNVDAGGEIRDGWGPWIKIDGWESWEDQGGGLALASFGPGQRPSAVVLHVDNPVQENEGRYAVLDLVLDIDQAADFGTWRVMPYYSEVLPVHAALLHTGNVLFFAGSGNNVVRRHSDEFEAENPEFLTSVVWEVATNTFDEPATLRRLDGQVVDFFCCGHCALPDGRILVSGGSDQYDMIVANGEVVDRDPPRFTGIPDAMIFEPGTGSWKLIDPMSEGRWYPTLVMLEDGRAIATSGLDGNGNVATLIEEIARPDTDPWTPSRDFRLPLYPHLFLLGDGRLFYTGGKMDTGGDSIPLVFDPRQPTEAVQIEGLRNPGSCNQCASVILPPAQEQRFMILGGGPEDEEGQPRKPATNRVDAVALSDQTVANLYMPLESLKHERMHVNAVLLPDRTVLVTGGGVTREATIGGAVDPTSFNEVFEGEIYHPAADKWTRTAPAEIARLYHSVALLLPDGRVVTAGGNPDKGSNVAWLPPEDPMEEMRLEIFSPPYLFKSDAANPRPVISMAPTEISYGAAFTVEMTDPQEVTLCIIRPGITTHSFNGEQRLVDLAVEMVNGSTWSVQLDADARIAPPGWYMLFATGMNGVPSVSHWVHLA